VGRIRTIKPEFFQHSDLYDAEIETQLPLRLGFAGLWTCCDREGRFKWRPRELKLAILPYDDCDFSRVLHALATRGFVRKYASPTDENEFFGFIPSWKKHQFVNGKEPQSLIPEPPLLQHVDACATRESRVNDASITRGVKERKGKEEEDASVTRAEDDPEEPLSPEVVAQNVLGILGLSGMDLLLILTQVSKSEMAKGTTAEALRDRLVAAWTGFRKAQEEGELSEYAPGAKTFFGEAHWKDHNTWRWKKGCEPSMPVRSSTPDAAEMLLASRAGMTQ
jgi:hypothetical protein